MYEYLKEEFEKLSEEEKNALMIYKSRLGLAINDMNRIDEIYYFYKDIINDPKNIFLKMSVFKDIDFSNVISFSESLDHIYEIVKKATSKIILKEDLTVYRMVSIKDDEELKDISKGTVISTSINIDTCSKFLINKEGYKHYLYQINLEKGSKVGICPYSILYNRGDNTVTLSKNSDQEEIIINKYNYNFENKDVHEVSLDNGIVLNIISYDSKNKELNSLQR